MRDLNERQSQLFFLLATAVGRYRAPELQSLVDADVADAAGTLAATYETAARGVIYEHRPASIPASRLTAAIKAVLDEVRGSAGSAFERDAALILRRIEEAARRAGEHEPAHGNPRALIALLGRLVRKTGEARDEPSQEPRLIVP